jgi:hypothetical protein
MSDPQEDIRDMVAAHGMGTVKRAIQFMPRLCALVKQGKERRIDVALDQAHASADDSEIRRRRDDETRPMRLSNAGEGHE